MRKRCVQDQPNVFVGARISFVATLPQAIISRGIELRSIAQKQSLRNNTLLTMNRICIYIRNTLPTLIMFISKFIIRESGTTNLFIFAYIYCIRNLQLCKLDKAATKIQVNELLRIVILNPNYVH